MNIIYSLLNNKIHRIDPKWLEHLLIICADFSNNSLIIITNHCKYKNNYKF
jgi:hypothetical protein